MNPLLAADTTTTTSDSGLFDGVDDFFNSGTWLVIRNLAIFFVVVFWLASAYWVYKDARRRIADPWMVAMATVLGLIPPFLGPLIYLFFRPPEYLEDIRERELEIRAMEERLGRARVALPGVSRVGRARVPDLPGLHDQAPPGVRHLQAAARAALAGVPVLRDADRAEDARLRGDDGALDRGAARAAADAAAPPACCRRRHR